MSDAEIQFREALYRSAIEAAYFLKRLCEGTEDDVRETNQMGIRLTAATELMDSALRVLASDDDPLDLADLELVEIITE